MFLSNKYTKLYFDIINKAIFQKRIKGIIYYESHHIIPKSLGGENGKLNRVLLTAREHYIIHWLLTKMCKDPQHRQKMFWAFHRLVFSKTGIRNFTSYQYEIARKIHSKFISRRKHWDDPGYREKLSNIVKKHWENNASRREKASQKFKETLSEFRATDEFYDLQSSLAARTKGIKKKRRVGK